MKNKKLFIIYIFIAIIVAFVIIFACLKKPVTKKDNISSDKNLTYKVEVGSYVKISSLIKNVVEDFDIETADLGSKKYEVRYIDSNGVKSVSNVLIDVVDTTPPVVMLNDVYSVVASENKDISKMIFCADNYDTNPKCTVEGKYDLSKVGEYDLKYIAVDSSNNKYEKKFTLKVKEKMKPSTTRTNFSDVVAQHKNDDTEIGIDVSKWQGNINWNKVKNAGASFVVVRLGNQNGYGGELKIDPYFTKNVEGALKAGLEVGVYYFSYATTTKEAEEQASFILKNISDYDITLPIVFDWENWGSFNTTNMSIIDINKVANAFINKVETSGKVAMLYSSKNYLEKVWFGNNMKYNNKSNVWLAHYTDKTTYSEKYIMWQLCSNGKIDGISGNVDIDIMYK